MSSVPHSSELSPIEALGRRFLSENDVPVNAWASLDEIIDSIDESGLEIEFEQAVTDHVNSLPDKSAKKTIECLMENPRFCYCSLERIFCTTGSKPVCLFILDNWFDMIDKEKIQDDLFDLDEGLTNDALWRLDLIQSYMEEESDTEEFEA